MKFLSSDFIAVSIGAAVIGAFSLLFYLDITKKVELGAEEVVGNVTFKRKTTQRKYSNQVVWEDVEQNMPVYNNDSIRTADLSEAHIRLKDGTEIALNENSMILLAMTKDQLDIEFTQGSMLATRGDMAGITKLNIKSGKAVVSIGKGDVKLDQGRGKNLNLSVRKGNAEINTGAGTKSVDPNQRKIAYFQIFSSRRRRQEITDQLRCPKEPITGD